MLSAVVAEGSAINASNHGSRLSAPYCFPGGTSLGRSKEPMVTSIQSESR